MSQAVRGTAHSPFSHVSGCTRNSAFAIFSCRLYGKQSIRHFLMSQTVRGTAHSPSSHVGCMENRVFAIFSCLRLYEEQRIRHFLMSQTVRETAHSPFSHVSGCMRNSAFAIFSCRLYGKQYSPFSHVPGCTRTAHSPSSHTRKPGRPHAETLRRSLLHSCRSIGTPQFSAYAVNYWAAKPNSTHQRYVRKHSSWRIMWRK